MDLATVGIGTEMVDDRDEALWIAVVGEGAWRGINTGSIGGTDIAVPSRDTRKIRNNSIVGLQSRWCNILPSIRYNTLLFRIEGG